MKFNIRGSKLEVTDAIGNYIETKLARLNKYFKDAGEIEANVVIKTQGINQRIDVTIPIKRVILRSEEVDKDLESYILTKIEERNEAKKNKNYELADQIRNELLEKNIILKDTREGTTYEVGN